MASLFETHPDAKKRIASLAKLIYLKTMERLRLVDVAKWLRTSFVLLFSVVLLWILREPVSAFLELIKDQEAVSTYIRSFGAWGPLVLFACQLLQVIVAFIPGHVFVISGGYVFGFALGFTLNIIFVVFASQLGFALARWAGRPIVRRLVNPETLEKWYRIGEKQGFTFFTIAFILPVFPTDMMNFVGGLSGISGRRFLAANFLGRLPSVIMLTLIGSHGFEFQTWHWVAIGVFAVAVFLAGRLVVARIERRHEQAIREVL